MGAINDGEEQFAIPVAHFKSLRKFPLLLKLGA